MSRVDTVVIPDDCDTIALAGGPYSNFAFVAERVPLARFALK